TISTINVNALDTTSSSSDEIVKDIYNLKIEKKDLQNQISKIDDMIFSKKESINLDESVEVVQLSFVDDDSLINTNSDENVVEAEIEGLEGLKEGLTEKINKLNEKESNLKANIGENISYGIWPVNGFNEISSPFGYRIHPITKEKKLHKGIDIPANYGLDILSTDYGVVTFSGVKNGYGNVVYIEHFDGKVSICGHNSENIVKEGDIVEKGQPIAKIGSTGISTGNHVHFELSVNGELNEGTNKCNANNCDLYIPLHMNASNGQGNGVECWTYSSNSSTANAIGTRVCSNLASLGLQNRGVKHNTGYHDTRAVKGETCLIEVLFCDNKHDCDIWNNAGINKIASLIGSAICNKTVSGSGSS
ncbi:MAG: peptidoglycan DD-metalloendopeptidase family protein, partial [Clostridiales bacterium]|nr:peptidoglycan DD-metalloendopeptidase family protein [Clostridiales bacterium]